MLLLVMDGCRPSTFGSLRRHAMVIGVELMTIAL
jgi:hypothetical protein